MSIKVLIVDDQVFDVVLTLNALDGCEVKHIFTTVGDGHEALRRLEVEHFDLVLLDLKMPRIDGFEFLLRLQGRPEPKPPVIVVSGSILQTDIDRARNLGALEYVQKSFNFAEFKANMQEALSRHGFCMA